MYQEYKHKTLFFPIALPVLFLLNTIIQVLLEQGGSPSIYQYYNTGVLIFPYTLQEKEFFRFITTCFTHGNWLHFVTNMSLLPAGLRVEKRIGSYFFLVCYLASGFFANLVALLPTYYTYAASASEVIILGSSGCIFGIMGALTQESLQNWKSLSHFSKQKMLLIWIILIASIITSYLSFSIALWAHLSGFFVGFVTYNIFLSIKSKEMRTNKKLLILFTFFLMFLVFLVIKIVTEICNAKTVSAHQAMMTGDFYSHLTEEKAFKWYLISAEKGNISSQAELARRYDQGIGIKQDLSRSYYWALKAAKQNNTWAQKLIANYYWNGIFVKKDENKAIYWLKQASLLSDPVAQRIIAEIYYELSENSLSNMHLSYFWCLEYLENPKSLVVDSKEIRDETNRLKTKIENKLPLETIAKIKALRSK